VINANIVVWLLTGGVVGGLAAVENQLSIAPLMVSFIAAMVMLIVLDLIRRQPVR
jgi:hypothetical protein